MSYILSPMLLIHWSCFRLVADETILHNMEQSESLIFVILPCAVLRKLTAVGSLITTIIHVLKEA
jgi:hypothetical protein